MKTYTRRRTFRRHALPLALSFALVPFAHAADAGAASGDAKTLDEVKVSADHTSRAAAAAPMQAKLDALQPESVLSDYYIHNIAPATADYLTLIEATPSSTNSSPNGPGLSSKNASVRGFQDGEYSVTFDGIPFGDPNAFGHATTSFFPGSALGQVVVDRGPGTASNLGNATFGGTVALYSPETTQQFSGNASLLYGSGNTTQQQVTLNSGDLDASGTRMLMTASHLDSDGLLDNAGIHQTNVLMKLVKPIADNYKVTVVSSLNRMGWNNFVQMPESQRRLYGSSYSGLNDDPESQAYKDYNYTHRSSDFEYVRFQRTGDGLRIDNRMYTYALDSRARGGVTQLGDIPNAYLLPDGGVPGAYLRDYYRAWGDMFKAELDVGSGWTRATLRAGAWLEKAKIDEKERTVDLSTGEAVDLYDPSGGYYYPDSLIYDLTNTTYTHQYFAEAEWRPTDRLTITPGIKNVRFSRSQVGAYEFASDDASGSYSKTLGLLSANYRFSPKASSYLQLAQGYQAPPADALQSDADVAQVDPQQTMNYQAGFVWSGEAIVADIDAYYIDFDNMINSKTEYVGVGSSAVDVYYNAGGVIYKGIEGELTWSIGDSGFSLHANGSLNSAKSKDTDRWIANAAHTTGMFGVLYDHGAWSGSLMTKYVGSRYAGDGEDPDNPNDELPAYNYTNFNIGYRFGNGIKLRGSVNNLFDHRTVTEGNGDEDDPTYYHMVSRNYSIQVSFDF